MKQARSRVVPIAIALCLATAAAAAPEDPPATGRVVYEKYCLKCHGVEGRGDGESAVKLGLHPRDFARGSFKCRSTPSGSLPTDADLYRSIAEGLPGSAMIKFGGKLSPAEIEAVVAYTKHLSGRFDDAAPAAPIAVPEPPATSREWVAEGEQVYRVLQCWKCHGVRGDGDGPMAAGLVDSWGEPIKAHDFTRRGGRFKCGGAPADLYRTLHAGVSGSPMPSYTEAFLYSRDAVKDPAPLAVLGRDAPAEVERYLADQPGREALAAMDDAERRALVEHRTWALAHYLLSLVDD